MANDFQPLKVTRIKRLSLINLLDLHKTVYLSTNLEEKWCPLLNTCLNNMALKVITCITYSILSHLDPTGIKARGAIKT